MATDPALERLHQVQHIVVLMQENRSFDQMLGYLKTSDMPEVNGLNGDEFNLDAEGNRHEVFEWAEDQTVFHPPQDHSGKILDPCHSKDCVAEQLEGGNAGFVKNFLATRKDKEGDHVSIPAEYHGMPMGYYGAKDLPTYDFLAHEFCVCDAWHSSVPGDTWPNRLFSLAGREGPRTTPSILARLEELFEPLRHLLQDAPIYEVEAFTRHLTDEQWRWYSHDPATLRGADKLYRSFDLHRDNFAFFDRQKVSILTQALEGVIVGGDSFLDDAATGNLRDVSWIGPNFIDLSVLETNSDDDHPPSDVRAGQALVLEIYEALVNSPSWEDTLLVVVYDEHGGFYDHVEPPKLEDGSGATYGVRVPALVIGPRVAKGVRHELFEHTSLIKSILLRFAQDPDAAIKQMGDRVENARHLGILLEDEVRTDIATHQDVRGAVDAWHRNARASRRGVRELRASEAPDGAGRPFVLHEFQEEFVRFALSMRRAGLRPGDP